jgi:hypothetical protein
LPHTFKEGVRINSRTRRHCRIDLALTAAVAAGGTMNEPRMAEQIRSSMTMMSAPRPVSTPQIEVAMKQPCKVVANSGIA